MAATGTTPEDALTRLLQLGGFPEPLLAEADADAQRWHQLYLEGLIRDNILEILHVVFTVLHGTDDRLVVFDALGRACDASWSNVSVVCAGFDQLEFKLEIFIHGTEQRFLATLDRLTFDQMPEFTNPSEPDNLEEKYRNLVKCFVEHSPKALLNRAAVVLERDGLSGDITEAISYPRPTAYAEEQTWLLRHATHPVAG